MGSTEARKGGALVSRVIPFIVVFAQSCRYSFAVGFYREHSSLEGCAGENNSEDVLTEEGANGRWIPQNQEVRTG